MNRPHKQDFKIGELKVGTNLVQTCHYSTEQDRYIDFLLKGKQPMSVPYQACPICNGTGQINLSGITSACYETCTTCEGNKIIPQYIVPEVLKG